MLAVHEASIEDEMKFNKRTVSSQVLNANQAPKIRCNKQLIEELIKCCPDMRPIRQHIRQRIKQHIEQRFNQRNKQPNKQHP